MNFQQFCESDQFRSVKVDILPTDGWLSPNGSYWRTDDSHEQVACHILSMPYKGPSSNATAALSLENKGWIRVNFSRDVTNGLITIYAGTSVPMSRIQKRILEMTAEEKNAIVYTGGMRMNKKIFDFSHNREA